jgi:hypothetical protein
MEPCGSSGEVESHRTALGSEPLDSPSGDAYAGMGGWQVPFLQVRGHEVRVGAEVADRREADR